MLNAAGRAGRAGYSSYGLTIAIPNDLITVDTATRTPGPGWKRLRDEVFGKNDQCLVVEDPIGVMLDAIESEYDELPATLQYFLGRLPVSEIAETDPTETLMVRSLSAFRARRMDRSDEFYDRIQNIISRRDNLSDTPAEPSWIERVASASGSPAQHVRDLDQAITATFPVSLTVVALLDWLYGSASSRNVLPLGLRTSPSKTLASRNRPRTSSIRFFSLRGSGWPERPSRASSR